MTQSASSTLFLAPSWIGLDKDDTLDLVDSRDGARLELTGTLREAFHTGNFLQQPALLAVARLNPVMERLVNSLVAADPGPLDRGVLLRGSGWSRLFLELTGRCNERCNHCYANSSPDVEEELDLTVVLDTLTQAKKLGFSSVQLTGGDPLLSKSCVPAAALARELGFPLVEVYTNGLALKGKLFRDLADLQVSFAFSLYGQDPLVHDVVTRVPGSHRRTIEAIKRTGRAGLSMRVGIIDTGTTGFDLELTRQMAMDLGVSAEAIGSDVQRGIGRGVFQTVEQDRGTAARAPTRAYASDFFGTAAVAYDGQVYPCIFSRDLSLGNIHDGGLAEVLERPIPVHVDCATLFDATEKWADRLTCWKCRFRAALLSAQAA